MLFSFWGLRAALQAPGMHTRLWALPLPLPLALWGPFSSQVAGRHDHSGQNAEPASSGQRPLVTVTPPSSLLLNL